METAAAPEIISNLCQQVKKYADEKDVETES